jgi:hypothetical protein
VNKRGVELSVNMLVIIILSLVVFGVGVQITYKIIYGANKAAEGLDSKTKEEIAKTLRNGNTPVVIPYNKKTIQRGGNDIIGIGLKNMHPSANSFKMQVDCIKGFDSANVQICDEGSCTAGCDKWWIDTKRCIPIEPKNTRVDGISISVPKAGIEYGNYFFTLKVEAYTDKKCTTAANPQYLDVTRTFYITVNS